ncbi:MAG: FAD-binding oxidoreductase [Candidatus Hermodarchaeota archaeon]
MKETSIYDELVNICGSKAVSNNQVQLAEFSEDMSYYKGKIPKLIVYPSTKNQIEKILKLANKRKFSIVPISSKSQFKHHGDTIPRREDSIILNLSNMNKILSIDRKNRVVMVEPGVTFGELIPKLREKGLRLLTPLNPTTSKSVLTAALEREPITIPRYQWDSSDPLLCTEVVFGTGDLFRTGTAAGPGTIKQQKKMGQAQVNPMGPTQFSPYRVIQGAQGSLGIVTWATLKLELIPSIQKVHHYHTNNLQELLNFQQKLLKYRLCDEIFILNDLNLACLLKREQQEIYELVEDLGKWNLIYVISGRGSLAKDRISYLEGDIEEIRNDLGGRFSKSTGDFSEKELLNFINNPSESPWRMKLKRAYQDIFFLTSLGKISGYVSAIEKTFPKDLGIYIQPTNQGTSYYCEFDIFYDPTKNASVGSIKEKYIEASIQLMEKGAFFYRPYGDLAADIYTHHSPETVHALKKIKKIFDPNNILNPGVLCFDD